MMNKATDTKALKSRIKANQSSLRNFDEWLVSNFPALPLNSKILDLGCGTGKQLFLFYDLCPKDIEWYALDISRESIETIKKENKNIKLICLAFERSEDFFQKRENFFDLIYSCYALYYCQRSYLKKLISLIYNSLKDGGIFWVIGPYKGTNKELFEIIEKYYDIPQEVFYSLGDFYLELLQHVKSAGFSRFECSFFENKILFSSANQLFNYWKNTTFYNENFEKEIKKEINNSFDKTKTFKLTKMVISYKFYK